MPKKGNIYSILIQTIFFIRTTRFEILANTKTPRISIRLELNGDMAQKFEELKDEWGMLNNTEIVRRMIKETYDTYITNQRSRNNKSS